jgi:NAD(P)-dependent dehydrogenase (short-subunit alcohol dehydrogenase family)
VQTVIKHIVARYGSLDLAFNNAGVQSPALETADVSNEGYDRVLNINLKGVWNCMKYELQQMWKQESASYVIGQAIAVDGGYTVH